MVFGINTTRAFGIKFKAAFVDFSMGFAEEIVMNVTSPAEAGATTVIQSQTVSKIANKDLARTASTAIATGLSSAQVRGKIVSIIASATPNLI